MGDLGDFSFRISVDLEESTHPICCRSTFLTAGFGVVFDILTGVYVCVFGFCSFGFIQDQCFFCFNYFLKRFAVLKLRNHT